jgi:hypothetical protein
MAHEAEASGYAATIREPLPDYSDQWSVVCEVQAITSPDFVRDADDFFQGSPIGTTPSTTVGRRASRATLTG